MLPYASIGRAAIRDSPEIPSLSPTDLRHVFRSQNLFVKKVDDARFFAALEQHEKAGGVAAVPYGLRACAFALLSLQRRIAGDADGEAAYSSWALHSVDAAMSCEERPSEQLVSALVLLELSLVHAGRLEGTLSGLARHLAEFLPATCSEIAFGAGIFHKQGIFSRCGVVWPSSAAAVGASRTGRLTDLLSFAAAHLSGAVEVGHETAPTFFALLDEAAALQVALGGMLADVVPCRPTAAATKAVVCIRLGNPDEALAHAAVAFSSYRAAAHSGALLCVSSFAKLLLSLPPVLHACRETSAGADACRLGLRTLDEPPFSVAPMAGHFSAVRADLAALLLASSPGAPTTCEPLTLSPSDVDRLLYCAIATIVDGAAAADAGGV